MGQYLRIEASELYYALYEIFEDEARLVDQEFTWVKDATCLRPLEANTTVPWLIRKRDLQLYCDHFHLKAAEFEKYFGGEFLRWKRIDKFKDWIMILVRPERLEQETGFHGLFGPQGDKIEFIAQTLKSLPQELEFKAMMCLGLSKPESLRKALHPTLKAKLLDSVISHRPSQSEAESHS